RTFAGWYNGSEPYEFGAPVTGDITLTAKWNTKAEAVTISSLTYKNGAVTIDWDAVEGADGYRLYKKVPGGKWTKIKNTAVVTKYTDTDVEEGQKYYYVVRSHIDGVFNEDWAATAKSITPAVTPKPVTIADLSYASGAVTVTWDEVPGADGYRVYKKTEDGSWARINNNTTSTTLTDKKVEPDTTYYYVVRSQVGGVYNTGWGETVKSITIE
ncbi:MAG: fibronectin type III domain-containing protein, partial [Clostridia bacterium]|nr:fibronectin type III domain-containing protein [Clostridia bacterium]